MKLRVNGVECELRSAPTRPLLDVLRDELGDLTPKPGCREGRCGACTVLYDGEPIVSCLTPLGRVEDGDITTLEGLGADGELGPVQEAFERAGAVQCGICTPGMILTVQAMLEDRAVATEDDIRLALANNFCRCTGYQKIVETIQESRRGAPRWLSPSIEPTLAPR